MFLPSQSCRHENGFILVTVMLILLILTLIGIMATNTTNVELMVSGNDKVHKQTFYQADGGTELAERLVFENAVCATTKNGFTLATVGGRIVIKNPIFAESNAVDPSLVSDDDLTNKRGAVYYPDGVLTDASPHTNFLSKFTKAFNPGSGLQMVSGYEGLGAGVAGGGMNRSYLISSQHFGLANSQTLLQTQWRLDTYILSSAASSDCVY